MVVYEKHSILTLGDFAKFNIKMMLSFAKIVEKYRTGVTT
jgi:hypothetical protein